MLLQGREEEESDRMKKKTKIILGIVVLILAGILLYNQFFITGRVASSSVEIEVVPLSEGERQKVVGVLQSSEFIKDVPKEMAIALRFYDFEGGVRRWRDGFLIGRDKLLSSGEPDIYLSLHAKYIAEINGDDLCDVIRGANENGDLGFHSEYSKARLLLRYAGMLKHRKCFGF